jgi:tetratricopeptide (TPR) repeat protein
LPDVMVNRIAERTAGVPLHAVEFVRMMLNSGRLVQEGERFRLNDEGEELSIPDSIQAIIGARLDRLDADEVTVLQDASVLGLSFTTTDLGEMQERSIEEVEPILRMLVRREVLEFDEDPRSPERGQYRFVQSLIREVAYGRLSKSDRTNRHLKAAGRLEERGDIELAGVIASHYAGAVASDPENGELLDRARDAVVGAAERANSLRSAEQAAGLYLQAISMTDDPSQKASLQIAAAASYDDAGLSDRALEIVNEALEWYRSADISSGVVVASTQLASILSGNFEAQGAVDAIVPVFESTPAAVDETWARLASETSRALALAGRGEESVAVTDRALPVMEELDLIEELVNTLINRGTALAWMGRWLEGSATLGGAAELAKQHELTLVQLRALNNLRAVTDTDTLNHPATDLAIEELVERSGNLSWLYRLWFTTAEARYGSGDLDEALELIERSESVKLPEFFRDVFETMNLRIRNLRSGFDEDRSRQGIALMDKFVDSSDPQTREMNIVGKAWATFDAGQFALCSQTDSSGVIVEGYPYVYEPLLAAATWIGDVDMLRQMAEDFRPQTRRGRASRGLGSFADALLSALEGDDLAAVSAYRTAETLWAETGLPMSLAVMRTVFARSIGLDHPVGFEAGTLARQFFEEHDVLLYLDLLADGLTSSDEGETAFAV